MRPHALVLIALVVPGCVQPGVFGDGPVEACGTKAMPAQAAFRGGEASWIGVDIRARGEGVHVWLEATKRDYNFFSERTPEGWMLLGMNPDTDPPEVRQAVAALGRYENLSTSVHVAGGRVAPFKAPAAGASDAVALLEPMPIATGERLLLYAAATETLPQMDFRVLWTGCARTGEVVGGHEPGYAIGWHDLDAPLAAAQARIGAVGLEATFERATKPGVILAMAPPSHTTLYQDAHLTTSTGTMRLRPMPMFAIHEQGMVRYRTTHVGGEGSADQPLLAYFPLPLSELSGDYTRPKSSSWA